MECVRLAAAMEWLVIRSIKIRLSRSRSLFQPQFQSLLQCFSVLHQIQCAGGVKTSPLICNPSDSCCPSLSRELISTLSNRNAIGSFSRSYENLLTLSIVPEASTRHCTVMNSSESCFN